MRRILVTCCLALLGPGPSAIASGAAPAAEAATPACGETDAPCWRRRCERGDADACAIAKLCDSGAPPRGAPPAPDRLVARPAAQAVEAYLAATSARTARESIDLELVGRAVALYTVLADPGEVAPDRIEEVVDALVSAPDEDDGWVARRGCVLAPGSAADRDALAPVVYGGAVTDRMRAFVVETRARLDRAAPVVARCPCIPDQLFLVDVARRKIVARRVRDLPPRSVLILDPRAEGPPVRPEIAADAAGAAIEWRGERRSLPLDVDDLPAFEVVTATVPAPGREPYTIGRSVARRRDAAWRGVPESSAWFVVLRPAAGASR